MDIPKLDFTDRMWLKRYVECGVVRALGRFLRDNSRFIEKATKNPKKYGAQIKQKNCGKERENKSTVKNYR